MTSGLFRAVWESWHTTNIKAEGKSFIFVLLILNLWGFSSHTVCDCTQLIALAGDCQSHPLLSYPTRRCRQQSCAAAEAGPCLRDADNLLAMLPMKQRRCVEQSFDFPTVLLPGMPAWFSTVPQDQFHWAPPTIGLQVKLLSDILKLGKFFKNCFQCGRLAEILLIVAIKVRLKWEDWHDSHVYAKYEARGCRWIAGDSP